MKKKNTKKPSASQKRRQRREAPRPQKLSPEELLKHLSEDWQKRFGGIKK